MTRTDGLQSWRARRRRGDEAPQGWEVLKNDGERSAGPMGLERAVVVPSDKHGINVMLERALELNPWWREQALEASSSETAWKAENLSRLRCLGATIVVDGKQHEAIRYMDEEATLWPVKASRIAVRIELQEDDSWKEHELETDLALTRESSFHPGHTWAIVTPTSSLKTNHLAELLMVAYSGPPECIHNAISASQEARTVGGRRRPSAANSAHLRGEAAIPESSAAT